MRLLLALAAATLATAAGAADLERWKGGAAPALELQDLQGQAHRLADYRGRVVLVNFWATWCEPCREEMPSIERLRQSLKGKPFEVLAVNVGEPASRIERFREKLPMSFTLLLDRDTKTAKAWKARILPASFLIGRDGRIRYVHYGEIDWSGAAARARVDELLQ